MISSFKTGLQISVKRSIKQTPISLLTQTGFQALKIGDHFFLNLNSVYTCLLQDRADTAMNIFTKRKRQAGRVGSSIVIVPAAAIPARLLYLPVFSIRIPCFLISETTYVQIISTVRTIRHTEDCIWDPCWGTTVYLHSKLFQMAGLENYQ